MPTQIMTNAAVPTPGLVLYIPRISSQRATFIADTLQRAGLGQVQRVDVNALASTADATGQPAYCEAFVHFAEWWATPLTLTVQSAIASEGTYRLTLSSLVPGADREFWLLTEARNPLTENERRLHDRISELEQLVELIARNNDDELARRDAVMEQLVARVALMDLPEDHAPGEATLEEARHVAEIDPLLEIPETEAELPLALNEVENRQKAAALEDDEKRRVATELRESLASAESLPADDSNVTTQRGSRRRRGRRGGRRNTTTLTISAGADGVQVRQE